MICLVVKRLLPLYAGGDWGKGLTGWTERHLSQCPGCLAEYEALSAARDQVRELAAQNAPRPSADLAGRTIAQLATDATESRGRFAWPVRIGVAAAIATIVAGVGLLRESGEKGTAPLADAPVVQALPATAAFDEGNPAADYASQFEELSRSQIRLLLKRLDRKKDLSDAELERKLPHGRIHCVPVGHPGFSALGEFQHRRRLDSAPYRLVKGDDAMNARIFICALITAVGSSILTAPARAQDGDRIEEILPAGVGLFEFQSITLQEFIGMMKVMGVRTNTG